MAALRKAKYRHTVKEASQFRSYTSLFVFERLVMAVAKSGAIYTRCTASVTVRAQARPMPCFAPLSYESLRASKLKAHLQRSLPGPFVYFIDLPGMERLVMAFARSGAMYTWTRLL